MSSLSLQLDPIDPADARDEVRFGTLGEDQRAAVWIGARPSPTVAHESIAPLADAPSEAGEGAYLELLPTGVRLVELEPPEDLIRYVIAQVLLGLQALHKAGGSHGAVDDRHIVIGLDGEVVLFGRGRRPGSPHTDVLSAMDLLPPGMDITVPGLDAAGNAQRMLDSIGAAPRARLSGWARTVKLGSVDEITSNLGPEGDATGLLDRYEVQSEVGLPHEETQDDDSSTQMSLGSTLWRSLIANPVNPAPPDRFTALEGKPSRAVRQLLKSEALLRLDLPTAGPIPPFVIEELEDSGLDDPTTRTQTLRSFDLPPPPGVSRPEPVLSPTGSLADYRPNTTESAPATRHRNEVPWVSLLLVATATAALVSLVLYLFG